MSVRDPAPRDGFQLHDWLDVVPCRRRFAAHSAETFDAVMDCDRLASEVFAPATRPPSRAHFDEHVTVHPQVVEAVRAFAGSRLVSARRTKRSVA
jgi:hypothetical protein